MSKWDFDAGSDCEIAVKDAREFRFSFLFALCLSLSRANGYHVTEPGTVCCREALDV